MFRYLPQSGASPLWPVLFVWVLLNSCCGELKYANFSEINSNYTLPPARVCVIWNLTIAYGPLRLYLGSCISIDIIAITRIFPLNRPLP